MHAHLSDRADNGSFNHRSTGQLIHDLRNQRPNYNAKLEQTRTLIYRICTYYSENKIRRIRSFATLSTLTVGLITPLLKWVTENSDRWVNGSHCNLDPWPIWWPIMTQDAVGSAFQASEKCDHATPSSHQSLPHFLESLRNLDNSDLVYSPTIFSIYTADLFTAITYH